jgi:hypothetical protein
MKTPVLHSLVVIALSASGVGCAMNPSLEKLHAGEAKRSEADIVSLARRAAERKGIDLRAYHEPDSHRGKDGKWIVFFVGKVAMPGNHFSVEVTEGTGETHVRRGK